MKLILSKDDPILRVKALTVDTRDIDSKKIKDLIKKMKGALHAEEDGVAIAAPQIGESLRIFIVNGKTIALAQGVEEEIEDMIFINPKITKASQKKMKMEEGCLSVRWLYGEVLRHEKVTVEAFDERGQEFSAGASGLLAQIFQHEIDHLEGILFTDKAENVRDLPPPQNEPAKN